MINKYNFNTKCIEIRARRKPEQVYQSMGKLDFDQFLTEVKVVQTGSFSNRMEYGVIYQLCFTSSFFPTTFYLSFNTI